MGNASSPTTVWGPGSSGAWNYNIYLLAKTLWSKRLAHAGLFLPYIFSLQLVLAEVLLLVNEIILTNHPEITTFTCVYTSFQSFFLFQALCIVLCVFLMRGDLNLQIKYFFSFLNLLQNLVPLVSIHVFLREDRRTAAAPTPIPVTLLPPGRYFRGQGAIPWLSMGWQFLPRSVL